MKTYEPRRNNECPNGIHATYNPALDPTQNECTCPWLVIASSTPVQHLTSWSRRELENVIRETDRGYFDPPGYPLRSNSMFLSPNMQRLVDMAEKEPVAAALTLLAGAAAHGDSGLPPFDAIAWDAEDGCLSIRVGNAGGWRRLWLGHANVDAITDQDNATAGGASPVLLWADHPDTAAETDLPEGLVATPHDDCTCDLNTREQCINCQPAQDYFPIFDETAAAVESLPRRVPQVPSAIAEAGITRGGIQFPTDVPEDVFHAAQESAVGQRAMCANDTHPEGHFVCQLREDHEGWHADGSVKWEAGWHMS